MNALDIFIKALQNRMPTKLGNLIPHYYVTPQKFPAIKEHTCEIFLVGEGQPRTIVICSIKDHDTTIEETNSIKERLWIEVITKLLEYYGL